ncbi:hypothetical protein LX36DRAFT_663680 [Colletotrichum falcatum]|nr:hypothetical protein LX36DRAFT_663680 [Colletotrichum falcatum]
MHHATQLTATSTGSLACQLWALQNQTHTHTHPTPPTLTRTYTRAHTFRDPRIQPLARKGQNRHGRNSHPHAALPPNRPMPPKSRQSRMLNMTGTSQGPAGKFASR